MAKTSLISLLFLSLVARSVQALSYSKRINAISSETEPFEVGEVVTLEPSVIRNMMEAGKASYRRFEDDVMNWDEKFNEAETCSLVRLFTASARLRFDHLKMVGRAVLKLLQSIPAQKGKVPMKVENAVPDNKAGVYLIRIGSRELSY